MLREIKTFIDIIYQVMKCKKGCNYAAFFLLFLWQNLELDLQDATLVKREHLKLIALIDNLLMHLRKLALELKQHSRPKLRRRYLRRAE